MSVRAKFSVTEIKITGWQSNPEYHQHTIKLSPVTGGSEENKAFFTSTPVGEISITTNQNAAKHFHVGEAFYVDFTLAE